MMEMSTQYVIALFDNEESGETVLKNLTEVQKMRSVGVQEVALVRKDSSGKIRIFEPADMGGGKGAAIGGVIGGLVGLIFGPGAILTAGAGAMIGGLAAKLSDSGFDNKDLKELAKSLKPGGSALLILVEQNQVSLVVDEMKSQGGTVITDALHLAIADELENEYKSFFDTLQSVSENGLLSRSSAEVDDDVNRMKDESTQDLNAGYLWPLIQVN